VTPQCGSPTKTYNLSVTRAASAAALLSDLLVRSGLEGSALQPEFDPETSNYTTTISYDLETARVTLKHAQKHSTATVDGAVPVFEAPLVYSSQDVTLTPGQYTTVTIVVTAQDLAVKRTYTVRIMREMPPAAATQIIRGSLRDASCLKKQPSLCHKTEYHLKNVVVSASNPVDGTSAKEVVSNDLGIFELALPMSKAALGSTAFLKISWPYPSQQSNLPGGMQQVPVNLGAYSAAGQGFALDISHDAGFIFWYAVPGSKPPFGNRDAEPPEPGKIYGKVMDALTNWELEEAVVVLHTQNGDKNSKTHTLTTDWEGKFEFGPLAPGVYRLKVTREGYSTVAMQDLQWNTHGLAVVMSPQLTKSQVRLVMTWSEYPAPGSKDMDIHLMFRPSSDGDCDVHWSWMNCGHATLDRDNVKGGQNGAETITIDKPLKTVYTVYVDNYLGDLNEWRDRSTYGFDTPRASEIDDGQWMSPEIPASAFDAVPLSGWATELAGTTLTVYDKDRQLIVMKAPSHPEDPATEQLYRDKPATKYDGSYRPEARYVRLLCLDFTGSTPKMYKVPQFSSTPPKMMERCV